MVGVLILIHQHIAELILIVPQDLRLPLQQCYSVKDNVIKVQRVSSHQFFLVGGIDFCNPALFPVVFCLTAPGEILRRLVLVLGVADGGQDALGLESLFVQVLLLHDILDDSLSIVGIVDRKVLVKTDAVNVPPKNPDTGGVEGGGPDVVGHRPQTGREALLQFPRRLVGKGDGDNLPGPGHIYGAQTVSPVKLQIRRPVRKRLQKVDVFLLCPLWYLF